VALPVATMFPPVTGALSNEASEGCAPETLVFVDATRGWLGIAGVILATSDGGRTWRNQYRSPEPQASVQDIDFVDTQHGFAVVSVWATDLTEGTRFDDYVVRTVDGGRSWSMVTPESVGIQCLDFLTPFDGYAITTNQTLVATSDGGAQWARLSSVAAPGTACFGASGMGWAVSGSLVERTVDGGAHWTPVHVPGERFFTNMTTIECFGQSAWLTAILGAGMNQQAALVMRTLDGGAHWRVVDNQGIGGPGPGTPAAPDILRSHPGPFELTSADDACLSSSESVFDDVELTVTMDGGGSFVQRPVLVNRNQNSGVTPDGLSFVSPEQGWLLMDSPSRSASGLVSQHQTLFHTSNAGTAWTAVAAFEGPAQVMV
jgi:photosystem II stability/assembly factor-like uncharacterized protein